MSNSHFQSVKANDKSARGQMVIAANRAGYNDRLANRPWPRALDMMPELYQVNYENGRLVASNILAAGLTPPRWGEKVTRPRGLMPAVRLSAAMIGSWRPAVHIDA